MPGWGPTTESSLSSKMGNLSRKYSGLPSGEECHDGTESMFSLSFRNLD